MSNQDLLEETAKCILSLESRRSELLHKVHQVERELLNAKARHGKLVNQARPIATLPREILSDIFQLCHGTKVMVTRTVGRPFEVVVSHVSTHWRNVALGSPLLWNIINLHITNQTQAHALQRLSTQLIRSKQCFLDISLHLAINNNIPELLRYLTPHAHRWHRVSISMERGSPDDFYAPFCALAAPNLVHLSLRIGNSEDNSNTPRTEYPDTCPPILTQGSPSLTFVRIAGKVVGNLSPPLGTTRTLHVDAWPQNQMSLAQFHSLLAALPCLVHLSLTGLSVHLPRNPLHTPESIPLLQLRSLRIRGNSTPCHRLLSLVSLPQLESLLLQGVETFDSTVIPSLHTLTLDSCSFSAVALQNLVRAFPRVVTLEIDDSTQQIYRVMTPEECTASIPWPELQILSLKRLPPADVGALTSACLSRLNHGSPLRRLYLDRRSRGVLKLKNLLDTLREMQPAENSDDFVPWPADLGYEDPDDAWY